MRNDRRSSTSLDLEGRVILITGAARGLGRAYANLLARHGAHIGVHDAGVNLEGSIVDPMFAKKTTGELLAEGLTAAAFIILLNGASSCRRLIFHVVKRFGRLDALIHNAGIVSWRDPAAVDPESFARSSRVNNEAAFFLTSAALQFMRERGFGRLVFTTSGWALQPASGSDELARYAHGKGAQFGLAMALARGAGHPNIRTNVIAPVAATRILRGTPPANALRPEAVAGAVAWLASPACTVTGCLVRASSGVLTLSRLVDVQSRNLGPEADDPVTAGAAISSMADPIELAET